MSKSKEVALKKAQLAKQLAKVCPKTGKPREKDVLSVVRSAVRKSWMRAPQKLSLLMKSAVHVTDVPKDQLPPKLNARTKWLYKCSVEGTYHIGSDVEVDHIVGEHSLKCIEDMPQFTKSILMVGWDDLRIVSKEAHSYLTYAERYGVTYEEAKKLKEVISIMKLGATKQKEFLKKNGVVPAARADDRRVQITKIILGE